MKTIRKFKVWKLFQTNKVFRKLNQKHNSTLAKIKSNNL